MQKPMPKLSPYLALFRMGECIVGDRCKKKCFCTGVLLGVFAVRLSGEVSRYHPTPADAWRTGRTGLKWHPRNESDRRRGNEPVQDHNRGTGQSNERVRN